MSESSAPAPAGQPYPVPSTMAQPVAGDVAHDGADSGNPVKVGGKARQTNPTAVADGDRTDLSTDDLGRLLVCIGQPRDLVTDQYTAIAASAAETTILTAAAGVFHDLTAVLMTNAGAAAVRVDFRDTTGGAIRFSITMASAASMSFAPPRPVKQTTANTNWTAQCSGAGTTINIFVQAEKNV